MQRKHHQDQIAMTEKKSSLQNNSTARKECQHFHSVLLECRFQHLVHGAQYRPRILHESGRNHGVGEQLLRHQARQFRVVRAQLVHLLDDRIRRVDLKLRLQDVVPANCEIIKQINFTKVIRSFGYYVHTYIVQTKHV